VLTQQAKEKSMVDYLASEGYFYEYKRGGKYYYYSPFRSDDSVPSFCVTPSKGIFKDFGGGTKAGDVIDLVRRISALKQKEMSHIDAITTLVNGNFNKFAYTPDDKEEISIKYKKHISNRRLIDYIQRERLLDISIVSRFCSEVGFSFGRDRVYTGLGIENKKGGYEIRNWWFKGGTSPKYYTEIGEGQCFVFEGFLNFLSWLQYLGLDEADGKVIILNSIENWKYIKWQDEEGYLFLDNDEPGDKTTAEILKLNPSLVDHRNMYSGYNDMNDMIVQQKNNRVNFVKYFILGR
jgi:hypothetical protein